MMLAFAGLVLMASVAGVAGAQQPPCVVVATTKGAFMPEPLLRAAAPGHIREPLIMAVPHLPPQVFVAREGRSHKIPIESVQSDEGPRRIVFVETFGSGWREFARQPRGGAKDFGFPGAELTAILSVARPQDSFALLSIGGPRVEVRFGSSQEALRAGIQAVSHPDPDAQEGPDLFDGLSQVASWFGAPQIGDSILEIGSVRRWRWDKSKAARLRTTLVDRGIRIFTLGGAYYTEGSCSELWDCGSWESPFTVLVGDTGGQAQDISDLGAKAVDAMRWQWQEAAKGMYEEIKFAYVIRLQRTGPRVKIEAMLGANWLGVGLSYPKPLPVCPPIATDQKSN
jgi:hypothetical protein